MASVRLIGRLDIKGPKVIKGIHLEGLRKMGDPHEIARRYYEAGIDELIYMDVVASLYGRNNLLDIVYSTTRDIFVPLTVGGGVRSVEDAEKLLRVGADKVALNTAALARPELIRELSTRYGAQCVVLSIEAIRVSPGRWEAYTDCGREHSGRDAIDWARQASEMGAGEILITSIDQEGTRKGFDVELTRAVSEAVSLPVIASGGMGAPQHLIDVVQKGKADAAAMSDILVYNRMPLGQIRDTVLTAGLNVRCP